MIGVLFSYLTFCVICNNYFNLFFKLNLKKKFYEDNIFINEGTKIATIENFIEKNRTIIKFSAFIISDSQVKYLKYALNASSDCDLSSLMK